MPISSPIAARIESAICCELAESYNLNVAVSRLPGENLNYLAISDKDEKYIVKIASDDQSESFVQMEFLALQQAAGFLSDIQLPQIIENKFGNIETFCKTGDRPHKRLRLIKFISGDLLELSDISGQLRFRVGKSLAKFDRAMEDFDHPAAHRPHRWDLTQASCHRDALEVIESPQDVRDLEWAFTKYTNGIAGKINQVIWQFIHGDANPENILVRDQQVVGLLDFGDSCHNPRICELAICLPYLMMDQADPLAAAQPIIEGYGSGIPLTELELNLLWPLVLGRIATTISIAAKRRQLDPNHPNWFVSEGRAWQLLRQLRGLPEFSL